MQAKSKQAMKQVLGIKNEAARMKVTPPLAVASLAHGDDMRWNPNDNGFLCTAPRIAPYLGPVQSTHYFSLSLMKSA